MSKKNFKLAILTDEVSQELDAVITFAKDLALDGIELRSLFGRAFKDLTDADIQAVGKAAREAGLKVAGCASPVFKCDLFSETEIADHRDLFKRAVETAVKLESEMVRIFTFLRRGTRSEEEHLLRAADHIAELLPIAEDAKILIGVENEASCIAGSGPETRTVMQRLPQSPRFGVVWDPCNVLYLEGTNDPVHEDFKAILPWLSHVHFKDAKREGNQPAKTCIEIGTGQVDFPGQLALLKNSGYGGWVTLETHWRSIALDAESQHLPAGYAFSANAEPASRICMGHLKRMISELA
jgi:sugar phosphate isomerase/epimerase